MKYRVKVLVVAQAPLKWLLLEECLSASEEG